MLKHQGTAAQDIGRYGNQAAQLKTTKPQCCDGVPLDLKPTIPATNFFHTHPLHDMLDILI
jgi:hypothetical protein